MRQKCELGLRQPWELKIRQINRALTAALVKKEKEEFEAKWARTFKQIEEDGPIFDHPVTIDELMKLI